MEEREGFVKDSKVAFKGVLNGILGSVLYQLIILLLVSAVITFSVGSRNPDASSTELETLVNQVYNSFPVSILISCLTSIATLIVFVVIIKYDTFKELCRKAFNLKVLKYGCLCALCIMGVSILYNGLIEVIFNLEEGGNANQENVVALIKSNALLGFLSVVILAPIVEELTYRYCIFGGLIKYKKWMAYAVAGIVFMAMHGISSYMEAGAFNNAFLKELIYLPPYLFSGLALAYVYDRTNNIGTSALAHALNNLVSFLAIVCL